MLTGLVNEHNLRQHTYILATGGGTTVAQRIIDHLQEHLTAYLLLAAVLIVGLVIGGQAPRWFSAQESEQLVGFINQLVDAAPGQTSGGWRACGECLLFNGGLLVAIWFLGLSVFGSVLTPPVLFYKGFTLTFGVSMLLEAAGARGFLLVLVTVLPATLIFLPIFVLATRWAVTFAATCLHKRNRMPYALTVAAYNKSFLLLVPFIIAASLVQGWLSPALLQGILALL